MLLVYRMEPTVNNLNETGYVPQVLVRRILENTYVYQSTSTFGERSNRDAAPSQYITISEDDIFFFTHDRARLMALVSLMFYSSYDMLGDKVKMVNDPVAYYYTLMHHILGNTTKDILETWN